jgi:hypothetical protein
MVARPLIVSLLPLLLASPAIAVAAQEPVPVQAAAPQVPLPDELVLEGDNIITVMVNGTPLRLEVDADSFGPPVINSEVAARLQLVAESRRGWRFGNVVVEGVSAEQLVDFGGGPVSKTISWAERFASRKVDGTIGVHHLPYARVTIRLAPPVEGETIQRFPMKRSGSEAEARLGTEVVVGTKKLMMIFALKRAENLITAPTANFIATHQDGGFEPGSDGTAIMNFAVERPTRMMRIAEPIMLGDLVIDRFAVRVEDYGDPKRVGEIGENDPRFDKGQILVSRRKGRGRPDLLTRIGRDQIAHCSQITYDLAQNEIRLSCGPAPE